MDEPGPPLLVAVDEGIARLKLNRPRRFNALDGPTIEALIGTLARLRADDSVKALLLSGDRRSFCFGADLTGLPEGEHRVEVLNELLPRFQAMIAALARFPVPTIAVLSGFATGAGLELALACDLRIASDKAKLGVAFLGMGLVPDGGGTHRLPRIVGLARAFELLYSEEAIASDRAEAIGLVNRVVPQEELEESALAWARGITALPPGAVRAAKRLILENLGHDLDASLAAEAHAQAVRFRSAEFEVALLHLLARRK